MLKRTLIAATLALCFGAGAGAQSADLPTPTLQDRVDALAQQLYRRYQHYPPALASRRAAAEETLSAWNDIAPLGEEQASEANLRRMTDWLDEALRAVMPGGSGELPAAPEFEEPAPPVDTPVMDPVMDEAIPADRALPPLEREVAEPKEAAPANDLPRAGAPFLEAKPQPTETKPQPTVEIRRQRSRIKVTDPVATIDNPYFNEADSKAARPRESVNPLRQAPRNSRQAESQFAGPRATAKPVVPTPDTIDADASAPRRSKWSQHPSAAPLEWRDPFADDPTASPNPLRSGSRHETLRPELRVSRSTKIDLRQLTAEVRGYNSAMRALQAAVMRLKETDVAALAAAEEELGRLDERRQFIDLYRAGLTPAEQGALPESPSAEVVRELVRRKTQTLSERASSSQREERRAQQTDWFEGF